MDIENLLLQISDKLDVIAERLQPQALPTCGYKLYAWLDEWFKTYRAPKLRDGGYDLRHNIEKHVKPHIEDKPLDEYTAHDIAKALGAVASDRMRQICRQIYNQCFREAARAGYIDRNPVDNVDGVKHVYNNGRSLTQAEESELLSVSAGNSFYPLIRFYLLTGARPSEPLSVTWQDIGDDTIRIRGTKTVLSDRLLPISAELRKLLNSLPHNGERLFPFTYQAVTKRLAAIRQKLSFEFTLKDLRHTFGTRCIEAGVSMKTVQKWLGHSNYGTTANIYSHITTEFERQEVEKLNRSGT